MQFLDRSLFALACFACFAILILQLAEIFSRLAGHSLTFVSEATGFLMAAVTFLGLAEVTRKREHLVADFLVTLMGPRIRYLLTAVLAPVATALCVAGMIWLMWGLARSSWVDGVRSEGVSRLPLIIPQAVILLGLVVMGLRLMVQICEGLVGKAPEFGEENSEVEHSK